MRDECEGNATLDGRCWTRARAESAVLGFSVRHTKKKKLGMVCSRVIDGRGVASVESKRVLPTNSFSTFFLLFSICGSLGQFGSFAVWGAMGHPVETYPAFRIYHDLSRFSGNY